ncbi:hypothetical protein [Halobacterium wangiae]|uniref:hypothetical protein n=1 Tax=Halobacterium wangiae TaxID=2902623 RepID=UPI001E58AE0D|nr:hypothetical protein [Halobacterium wangiae]
MVTLDGDVLRRYPRVSRYNSPYPAHDAGCAVDLYPGTDRAGSPVAGDVVETRTVRCPDQPYAEDEDHLVVVDTGEYLARMLHVDPAVEPGDTLAVGDHVGRLVRSGFFAPWVDNHVHLGFRERDQNAVRASGSLPLDLGLPVESVAWDGTGRVVETGETWARLDAPEHPAPGETFAGLAADDGAVIDGGLPHYEAGGATGDADTVSLLGTVVGDRRNDRTVTWRDVTPTANGVPIRGLSLWLGVDDLGLKLVCPGHDLSVGDRVDVGFREQ